MQTQINPKFKLVKSEKIYLLRMHTCLIIEHYMSRINQNFQAVAIYHSANDEYVRITLYYNDSENNNQWQHMTVNLCTVENIKESIVEAFNNSWIKEYFK